jgi:hypothetical protein
MSGIKRKTLLYLKNLPGWRTSRKLLVFSVDDYGSVRVASPVARKRMVDAGIRMDTNRFDQYDALETTDDLCGLFDALRSVRDQSNRHPVFTAFALPCNPDFDAMEQVNFQDYLYIRLPQLFERLKGYEDTWQVWKQGVDEKLISPEFHGREHMNVGFVMNLLRNRDHEALCSFQNRSLAGIQDRPDSRICYASAFDFDDIAQNEGYHDIIRDGLQQFETVFGFRASHFNSPGSREHHCLEKTLAAGGIRYMDSDLWRKEHQGHGKFRHRINWLGARNRFQQRYIIRNCMFEPLLDRSHGQSLHSCLEEIDVAFRMGKPANISSHRVNFAGHISERVRTEGLTQLRQLLSAVVRRWPDVEFVTSTELGNMISVLI